MDTDEQIDLNEPINWDKIDEEFSGDVFGLNYVYVFEENDVGKLKLYSRDLCFSCVFVPGINELKLKHLGNFRGKQRAGQWQRRRP